MSGNEENRIFGHELSVEELCKKLETNVETGLTDDQVKERQKKVEKIEGDEEVIMALARRNGCLVEIPATDLVVGDIVEVKLKGPLKGSLADIHLRGMKWEDCYFGEKIPADIRIIEADGFEVDEDILQPSNPMRTKGTEFTHENPLETENLAFYKTTAKAGSCVGIVCSVGSSTVWGRIAPLCTPIDF